MLGREAASVGDRITYTHVTHNQGVKRIKVANIVKVCE